MDLIEENQMLKDRVGELEQRVEHLRVSRRVLMNLLEKVEREKTVSISKLERALNEERLHKRRLIRDNPVFKLIHVVTVEDQIKEMESVMSTEVIQSPGWTAEKELMRNNPVERIRADITQEIAELQAASFPETTKTTEELAQEYWRQSIERRG